MRRVVEATIAAIATVVIVASLASAHSSLRAPRGGHLPSVTGAAGDTGSSDDPGESDHHKTDEAEPPEETGSNEGDSTGVDFSACEGLTGLDNAICRHEALLEIKPENKGLQNALDHLLENQRKHETSGHGHGVAPDEGSKDEASASHGNAGGNGNGHGNGHGNGNGNAH